MVSHVPGGSKDTEEYRWHMEFDKDMDSYASAVKEGLEPETVNQSGVKKARNQVKSHQRALKKLGISAQDAKDLGIRLAPGVE